jgi:class 3 adenylate cyclase
VTTCPNCGTSNPEAARFCMNCAQPLAQAKPGREARKVVTVVFADVTGSTDLGERLDPDDARVPGMAAGAQRRGEAGPGDRGGGAQNRSCRRCGDADTWRAGAGLAQSELGNLEEADRLTAEATEVAVHTDSLSAADAWEARARVLAMLGRRSEMLEAATRARELHAAKGSVNFVRRLDRFLAEQEVATPAQS